MSLPRRPARLAAWIAIFAVLLAALAPVLARALSPPQQAMPWNEICSVAGPQGARDALPEPGGGPHHDATFQHCPFCLSHAGQFALPATPPALALTALAGEAFPCRRLTDHSPRCTCNSPPSRAPPDFS